MSLKDLRKLGLLRPETEWSGRVPRTTVRSVSAGASAILGGAGCMAMVVGDGGLWTWLGLAGFGVALLVFTIVNVQAIGECQQTDDSPTAGP
jgi:hypothetical protein